MTIPKLMNCPHSGDGWCLECLRELDDQSRALLERARDELRQLSQKMRNSPHGRCGTFELYTVQVSEQEIERLDETLTAINDHLGESNAPTD